MSTVLGLTRLMLAQSGGPQQLARTPEPSSITDAAPNVAQYDQVMSTKLALAYAVGLEVAHRAGPISERATALDLACGPGHFTLCLARFLGYDAVTGIDVSEPMVAIAEQNAKKQGLEERVKFRVGDATRLCDFENGQMDLASFTDAAHHMPDLARVTAVLSEMERVTKPGGLILVMDLVRLRTRKITDDYVNLLGRDYIERGLPNFLDDFRNSMYAAWTPEELRQAIPSSTKRVWRHIVPRGLPSTQILLGLPAGRATAFVRKGVPWKKDDCPVFKAMRAEWRMLRATLALASQTIISPAATVSQREVEPAAR